MHERLTTGASKVLLEFDEDQRLWQQTVRDVATKRCAPALLREVVAGSDDGSRLWQLYVEHGWTDLAGPEVCVELAITLEELGAVADPTPYLATMSQFAPLAGDRFDPHQSGAAVLEGVTAHRNAHGWTLRGMSRFVLDGDRADRLAVATAAGVFLIDASAVSARRAAVFDPTLHIADLAFDDVVVTDDDRIKPDQSEARAMAVVGMAAHMVGACQRILDLALAHVKERHQFGVPIGSFQAIQHKATDMHVAIERARALTYFAALTVAPADPRRRLASAMAKAAAGDAQATVVRSGMQCFGGMALTWENDVQFAVKRAKAGEFLLGTAAEHRKTIAREYRAADF